MYYLIIECDESAVSELMPVLVHSGESLEDDGRRLITPISAEDCEDEADLLEWVEESYEAWAGFADRLADVYVGTAI